MNRLILIALALTLSAAASAKELKTGIRGVSAQILAGDTDIPVASEDALPRDPGSVQAVLRITNQRAAPIAFTWGGDGAATTRALTGPSPLSVVIDRDPTEIFMMGRSVVIPPGSTADIPLGALTSGQRGERRGLYALAPGDYELTVTLQGRLALNVEGEGQRVTIRTKLNLRAS
jgi:hypothetical protein